MICRFSVALFCKGIPCKLGFRFMEGSWEELRRPGRGARVRRFVLDGHGLESWMGSRVLMGWVADLGVEACELFLASLD